MATVLTTIPAPSTHIGRISRIGTLILICILCSVPAIARDSARVFIPHTPVTKQELEKYKAELVREYGLSESAAEEFIRNISGEQYKFTDDDFRKAFPQISARDKQASLCSNSIMGGVTRLVYLSPASENTVTVKSSMCNPVQGGLSCEPLSEHEYYFFESPDHRFTLDDGVSYEEASELLVVFRDRGLRGLPDSFNQAFGYKDVTRIGKAGAVYDLHLGEFFCRGCTATFKVIIEGGDQPTLRLVGEPEVMCV